MIITIIVMLILLTLGIIWTARASFPYAKVDRIATTILGTMAITGLIVLGLALIQGADSGPDDYLIHDDSESYKVYAITSNDSENIYSWEKEVSGKTKTFALIDKDDSTKEVEIAKVVSNDSVSEPTVRLVVHNKFKSWSMLIYRFPVEMRFYELRLPATTTTTNN